MGEIEAQTLGRIERAGLLDVCPENVAERSVHQVCPGVVTHDAGSPLRIGYYRYAVAHAQGLLCDDAMRGQSNDRIVRSTHFGEHLRLSRIVEFARIGHLT